MFSNLSFLNFKRANAILALVAVALAVPLLSPASAQGRFATVLQVGDQVVTRYQIEQRTRFLSLLRAPGDPRDIAREQLINEAVQMAAATKAEVIPTPAAIEAGQAEFAARANLSREEFLIALGQNGVDGETFRDFIRAGVAWRDYVRATFGEVAGDIPPAQIDLALARSGTEGGVRVLISELILPANTPETEAASQARATELLASLDGEAAFSAASRRFSVAPSNVAGGALNWVALENLPPEVQSAVANLEPGQISRATPLVNAIALFLLRDREVVPAGTPETLSVDYALFITSTLGEAREVAQRVDRCDDLYGEAFGLPEERLIRETLLSNNLPADVRAAIATLDLNETTTELTRNGAPALLMLCDRKPALKSTVDRSIIGNRLVNARIGGLAVDHLANLRASTVVVDLTQ